MLLVLDMFSISPLRVATLSRRQLTISPVGFFDPSVVCDVLALSVDAVQLDVDLLRREVPVLRDDALGLLQELLHRLRLPPVAKISFKNKMIY